MAIEPRYMVLGRGEAYINEFTAPKRGAGDPEEPRTFAQTQALLRPQVETVTKALKVLNPKQRLDEVVVELRLHERYLAKSYRPDDLLDGTGLTIRGMGTWEQTVDE